MTRAVGRRDLLIVGLASALGAPLIARAQSGLPPGVLRRIVASEITSLDPLRPTGQVTFEMGTELFVGLTTYDSRGRLTPGCAASWAMSADGLSWTFKLRPNLKWSDGRPLTATDFVFTMRQFLLPETGAAQASRLDAVRHARDVRFGRMPLERLGVSAPNRDTVRFELEYPDVQLPIMVSLAYCVPEHVIAVHGREWSRPENMVTNGPYTVESWAPAVKVVKLRRNPNFVDAADVAIERVEWLTGYDDATRLRLFRVGEVDIATVEDPTNLELARRDLRARLRSSPEAVLGAVGLNLASAPLRDPRLRRALALAVDRTVMVEKVRGLDERPWEGVLPPGMEDVPQPRLPDYAQWPMPQRLAEARQLAGAAGVSTSKPLQLGIGYPIPNPLARKAYLALSAMWRAIGVRLELQPVEGRAYLSAMQNGQFQVFSLNSFATVPTATFFLDRFLSDATTNYSKYRSAAFDTAFRGAERQLSSEARVQGIREAERILLDDLPLIPLFAGASHRVISTRVRGWVDHPSHSHPSRFLSLV